MITAMVLMTLLIVKHFLLDFWYQPPYQWMNKGTYGHMGGILHAGQHAVATFFILSFFSVWWMAPLLTLGEFIIHYHVDWAKMAYNKKMGWGANTHEQFWQLLGFDQLLHYLTYVGIVVCSLL